MLQWSSQTGPGVLSPISQEKLLTQLVCKTANSWSTLATFR